MQASPADKLSALPAADQKAFIATLTEDEAEHLLTDWRGFLARPDQIAPEGEWDIWAMISGRGAGKTRSGSEWIREQVKSGKRRIALIAETAADARDVVVEGESGILSVHPPDERPLYQPSKRKLVWPNGAVGQLFNATEPDQLRGPQFDCAWCDELAKWKRARETWDMLQFALRLGSDPRCLVTTTPRPIELVKAIVAGDEGKVAVTRTNTYANASNLSGTFLERIKKRYEGTRLGRQELDGEILGDVPNALWTYAMIEAGRLPCPDQLGRIVIGIDPAVSEGEDSNAHGLIAMALSESGQDGFVLEDGSLSGSPMDWARRAWAMFDSWGADAFVVEVNQGGDMVAHTLRSVRAQIQKGNRMVPAPITEVRASRGKHVRAEPVSAMYEQGRIHHIEPFPELEQEMTLMTSAGYVGDGSPDRVDALVWSASSLFNLMVREKEPPKSVAPPPIARPMAKRR